MKRFVPWLWALIIVAAVAGGAWGTIRWLRDAESVDGITASTSPAVPSSPFVATGRDYYFWVRLVEFKPNNGGKGWDTGGSGPDIYYRLWWQGNDIFTSDGRDDTLIAKWDLVSADLWELVKSHKIDIEKAIRQPIVRIDAKMTIAIDLYDADVGSDTLAARFTIKLDELKPGVNTITPPENSGVRRIEVQVIDVRTPLGQLIDVVAAR